MRSFMAVALVSAGLVAAPAPVRACEPSRAQSYATNPALADDEPPILNALSASVQVGDEGGGCVSDSKCPPFNTITLGPAATDVFTPPENIGYRITVVSGRAPRSIAGLGVATSYEIRNGQVLVNWGDAGDAVDFNASVVAIDRAGNESAPQLVRIKGDDGVGCSVARRAPLATAVAMLAFAALALTLTRRRSRAGV